MPSSVTPPPSREQFAALRAVAEGMRPEEAAQRYLLRAGETPRGAAMPAFRQAVWQVRAWLRQAGDGRWRLIGVVARQRPAASVAPGQPGLDEWAQAQGWEGFGHAELLALYAQAFASDEVQQPEGDAAQARTQGQQHRQRQGRHQRQARQRQQQLQALLQHEASALAARAAAASGNGTAPPATTGTVTGNAMDDWLGQALTARLRQAGVHTLDALAARIAAGGCWWRGLPGIGRVKAAQLALRVAHWQGRHQPAAQPPSRPVVDASDRFSQAPDPSDDDALIERWVAERARSPATARVYRRELRRFARFAHTRGTTLAACTDDDLHAYGRFLAALPPDWCATRRSPRAQAGWAPFAGPLSSASQGQALRVVGGCLAWLARTRVCPVRPSSMPARPQQPACSSSAPPAAAPGSQAPGPATSQAERQPPRPTQPQPLARPARSRPSSDTLPDAMREALAQSLAQWAPHQAAAARTLFLLRFVPATGLPPAELLRLRLSDLRGGWADLLRAPAAADALSDYLAARGLRAQPGAAARSGAPSSALSATSASIPTITSDTPSASPSATASPVPEDVPADAPLLAAAGDALAPVGYRVLLASLQRWLKKAAAHAPQLSTAQRQQAAQLSLRGLLGNARWR